MDRINHVCKLSNNWRTETKTIQNMKYEIRKEYKKNTT